MTKRNHKGYLLCYDQNGRQITFREWITLKKTTNPTIKDTYLFFRYIHIQTRWLGVCHETNTKNKPLIYETTLYYRQKHPLVTAYSCCRKRALKKHNTLYSQWKNPLYTFRKIRAYLIGRM